MVRVGPPATQFRRDGPRRDPDTADARAAGAITGRELKAMGIREDYAPVADVNMNALNPVIGVRSFSSDPNWSRRSSPQVKGYQSDGGIAATAKHFPGHGDTATTATPVADDQPHPRAVDTIDAPPFKAAIKAGIDSIMTAHIVVPSLDPSGDPATLSKPILTGILREELGSTVSFTDALGMAGVRDKYGDAEIPLRAIEAGADQLLMPPDPDLEFNSVLSAVRSGPDQRAADRPERRADPDDEAQERRPLPAVRRPRPRREDRRYAGQLRPRAEDRRQQYDAGEERHRPAPAVQAPRTILVTGCTTTVLGTALQSRGHDRVVQDTGAAPTDAKIADAVTTAATADVTVVLPRRRGTPRSPTSWPSSRSSSMTCSPPARQSSSSPSATRTTSRTSDRADLRWPPTARGRLDGVARQGPVRRDRTDRQAPRRHPRATRPTRHCTRSVMGSPLIHGRPG